MNNMPLLSGLPLSAPYMPAMHLNTPSNVGGEVDPHPLKPAHSATNLPHTYFVTHTLHPHLPQPGPGSKHSTGMQEGGRIGGTARGTTQTAHVCGTCCVHILPHTHVQVVNGCVWQVWWSNRSKRASCAADVMDLGKHRKSRQGGLTPHLDFVFRNTLSEFEHVSYHWLSSASPWHGILLGLELEI